MRKVLWKDSVREIRLSLARFISIFAIIFVGVAFFAGIKSTAPDMKHSVDMYYDEYDMTDLRVVSTLGLLDGDIEAIEKSEGVEKVQPGYFCDVLVTLDSTQFVYKVHSIPQEVAKQPDEKFINRVKLVEGRYPNKSGECIIENPLFFELGLKVGDEINVSSGKDEKITDNTLKVDKFTIVGVAEAPYYLSFEKGPSDIGSGKANYFMMILDEDFIIPCYTEALITVKGAKELNSYDEEYEHLVEKVIAPLENLGIERTQQRIDDIRADANKELDEAKQEYEDEKARYDEEITSAEDELDAAQIELVEGQATLDANKESFDIYYKESSAQLDTAQRKLDDAEEDYTEAENDYNELKETYGDDLDELNETVDELNEQRAEAQATVDELYERLEDDTLTDEERESIEQLIAYYEEYISTIDDQLEMLNNLNNLGQETMESTERQLAETRRELDKEASDLATARRELRNSKKESEKEFEEGQKAIDEGWIEYNEGVAELEEKKLEGQAKLDEGLEKIQEAEKEIERLKKPQWYVLDRNQIYSFVDYGKTADRMNAIAKVFPAFFFIVASLVCLTTMTRMVDEQRGCIGTYKALGYNNSTIARKYVIYAAIASILGGVSGLFAGIRIFPKVIYDAWTMKYTLPTFMQSPQVLLMVASVLIGVLVTSLAALVSCDNSLKETPSVLMRPKSPKPGKKVFLENIKGVWSKLSFSQKVTVRNLFRYKKRFFMTIMGILGCCSLLLAGFGLSNSISQVVDKQYKEIFTYDLNMRYSDFATQREKNEIIEDLKTDESVLSFLPTSNINVIIKGKEDDIAVSLIVPDSLEKFKDYVTLRHRVSMKPITLMDKGMIVTEKLAKELKANIGDFVEISNEDGQTKKAMISEITENYVFHYAYMSKTYYDEIFLSAPDTNNLMIKLNDANSETETALGSKLISSDAVSSIEYYSEAITTFSDTVKILNSIVIVIIASAGLLAFVVVYNLTNINICERIREIATLKVLGFYQKEVGAYVYRENLILGAIGAIIGLATGVILHRFVMVSLEQDGIMFGDYIKPISFLYAFVITLGFVALVNLIMYRRIKNIPMVESLKSVE